MASILSTVLASAIILAQTSTALNPIKVQGQDFLDTATGNRFEIIGVDYQPGGSAGYDPYSNQDPLTNTAACLRDAALMQHLGINTIRTYNVNPAGNHDECVSIFNAVGIYIIIDVNSPLQGGSLDAQNPSGSYNLAYVNRTMAVVEAFRNYPNLIGFFSGNEVINDYNTGMIDAPYIRAITRDLKQYIAARGGRTIPVGYSAADVRPILTDTSNYLSCSISSETGVTSSIDFFGLNSYSWCGQNNFYTSTYNVLASNFAQSSIPVFFSEFGCIVPKPRYFTEIPVLYGPMMTDWSGGLVYEWTEDGNGYGLVMVEADGSLSLTPDFNNLQAMYQTLDFGLIQSQNTTATSFTAPECSASLIDDPSSFSTSFDIPAAPAGVDQLISDGVAGVSIGSIIPVTQTVAPVVVTLVGGATTSGLTITIVSSALEPQSSLTGIMPPSSSAKTSPSMSMSMSTSTSKSATAASSSSMAGAPGRAVFVDGSMAGTWLLGLGLATLGLCFL